MSMPVIVSSGTTRCQAITDVIESIALEQTALSHILNAEGEKIQRVIQITGISEAQLIETNSSVQAMVEAITRLEIVLKSKLDTFSDCICFECEDTTTA